MKTSEILRRLNMWTRRYHDSLNRSNVHRQDVLFKNLVFWSRRYYFRVFGYFFI